MPITKKTDNKRKTIIDAGPISTVLGAETHFNGIMTFRKSLQINGRFDGEIDAEGLLVISPGAEVHANVKARQVIIGGKVVGNVVGLDKVELLHSAEMTGNIKTQNIQIEDGALFEGNCERPEEAQVK